MLKSAGRKIVYKIYSTELDNKNIDYFSDYDVISFDIFDTMLKRDVALPEDVFRIVGERFEIEGDRFLTIRKKAEVLSRSKSKNGEVTLSDIYKCLEGFSDAQKTKLMRIEEQTEIDVACANLSVKPFYDWCLDHNKIVILISDMYLSSNCIRNILEKCGYKVSGKIYVSCEQGCNKANGDLFRKIKLTNKKWIHIGDSIKGDYFVPRKQGIDSKLINRNKPCPKYVVKYSSSNKSKQFAFNCLKAFIENHESHTKSEFYRVGYEILGPMLVGFSIWLNNKIKDRNYSKVLFLARDARILLETYNILFTESEKNQYFYISRKAALNTTIDLLTDYQELHDLYLPKDSATIDDLCRALAIPENNKKDFLQECGLDNQFQVNQGGDFNKERVFTTAIKYSSIDSKQQRGLLLQYLNECGANNKFAVVDLGWEGRTQWCLKKILPNTEIDGYYIGIITKCPQLVNALSKFAYFGEMKNTDYNARVIMESIALFESMFLTNEGSTLKYTIDIDGKIVPIKSDPDQIKTNQKKIEDLQLGAISFAKDVAISPHMKNLDWDADVIFELYAKFATQLDNEKVKLLRNLQFRDVGVHILGAEHNTGYYIMHPHQFINETWKSYYRILFLKDALKLPLPYFDILYHYYKKKH